MRGEHGVGFIKYLKPGGGFRRGCLRGSLLFPLLSVSARRDSKIS